METAAERVERIRAALLFRSELQELGTHDRAIAHALRTGEWIRIASGVYTLEQIWRGWFPEERHLARAIAVDHSSRSRRPVFSHLTTSVILGLPGYRLQHERVHLAVPDVERVRASPGVIRHLIVLDEDDVMSVAGLMCTRLERTLADVARTATPEQSAVCLDAGLRKLYGREVADLQEEWREAALMLLDPLHGHRGVRIAKRMIEFADGRAESPAESLNRLQLHRLHYTVEIQVEIPTEDGLYRVDFDFVGQNVFGEVDGAAKYQDEEMLRGLTPAQAVLREKHREDWVSGAKQARFVRWGFRESESAHLLGARLRRFGVHPLT